MPYRYERSVLKSSDSLKCFNSARCEGGYILHDPDGPFQIKFPEIRAMLQLILSIHLEWLSPFFLADLFLKGHPLEGLRLLPGPP